MTLWRTTRREGPRPSEAGHSPRHHQPALEGVQRQGRLKGRPPPYTMPCDRNNQTYYPLQVNLDLKKGSTHELQIQDM